MEERLQDKQQKKQVALYVLMVKCSINGNQGAGGRKEKEIEL